ncbi:hypothetical protein [Achromobacter sp. UMC46]|uniref:hypothetical protein n=1 Tax=Achromobacter sp. UMC46 TaxID=1862319 RepID=UPI0015FF20EB|nr:hypothetical protein [Achromobacter sp. UMC46]MBB1596224.1 hypothetical protein [Achromobacter sp. UMC46]
MMGIRRAVLLHRLKTASYAIGSVVLISWVTDALNEGLMFKPVLRYFYPAAVENYLHPFTDRPSLMIWLMPLLLALLLMFVSSMMTVHHFKRRVLYRMSPPVASPKPDHLITLATGDQTLRDLPPDARGPTLHALYRQAGDLAPLEAACAAAGITLHARPLPDTADIRQLTLRLDRILAQIRRKAGPAASIAFDLSSLSPELASAATIACLENSVMLCYLDTQKQLRAHRVICEISD